MHIPRDVRFALTGRNAATRRKELQARASLDNEARRMERESYNTAKSVSIKKTAAKIDQLRNAGTFPVGRPRKSNQFADCAGGNSRLRRHGLPETMRQRMNRQHRAHGAVYTATLEQIAILEDLINRKQTRGGE